MFPCIRCEGSPCCCSIACCITRSFFCFSTVPTRSCRVNTNLCMAHFPEQTYTCPWPDTQPFPRAHCGPWWIYKQAPLYTGMHALASLATSMVHTSRNLLSCRSCPFSARSCVTIRIASVMMEDLSVFAALPGSSTLESSAKLQKEVQLVSNTAQAP